MADYVTTDQVGDFAQQFAQLNQTGQELLVTAASRLFDNKCEVSENFFAAVAEDAVFEERDFYGDDTAYLRIDPFTELNSVDPVVIDTDPDVTYDLPEYTALDNQLIVLDKTKQMIDEAASYPHRFVGWRDGVKVTVSAKWGWTATPSDVQLAVIHLAIHLWRTADPAFAVLSNVEGASARAITLPEIAQTTIEKYREKYSRRALFA